MNEVIWPELGSDESRPWTNAHLHTDFRSLATQYDIAGVHGHSQPGARSVDHAIGPIFHCTVLEGQPLAQRIALVFGHVVGRCG